MSKKIEYNGRSFEKNQIVKHFKRQWEDQNLLNPKYLYKILDEAEHTETGEHFVIYKSEETGKVYARPISMFFSEVDSGKYPESEQQYRFEVLTK